MVRPAFNRDNILTDSERAASARRCLFILENTEGATEAMRAADYTFYVKQRGLSQNIGYAPSEPQLQWLRDLVDRYT